MTFSILARDPASGALGIAIASRFLAVGGICPFVFSGLGALSTQASGFPPFGHAAERLLAEGLAPAAVLDRLLHDDPKRETRQLHLIDATGRIAGFNGAEIIDASGHRSGADVSVAGNTLAGTDVLEACRDAYLGAPTAPFAERLLLALDAGQAAGGDRRGQQGAGVLVYGAQPFPLLSLRIDDDADAIAALRRLRRSAEADYIPYMRRFASGAEIAGVFG